MRRGGNFSKEKNQKEKKKMDRCYIKYFLWDLDFSGNFLVVKFFKWNIWFLRWNIWFLRWNIWFLRWNIWFLRWNIWFLKWNIWFLNVFKNPIFRWVGDIFQNGSILYLKVSFLIPEDIIYN